MKRLGWCLLLGAGLAACGQGEAEPEDPKVGYQGAADAIAKPVAIIAAYRPHLDMPKLEGEYVPKDRSDLDTARKYAADAIRHVANEVRQHGLRSKSATREKLAEPFTAVAVACATPDHDKAIEGCKESLVALDKALAEAETKAKEAGVSSFPRLEGAGGDEAAKKVIQPFLDAMGPGPAEQKLLAAMESDSAKPDEVVAACETAKNEQQAVVDRIGESQEDLQKVAIVHHQKMVAWCTRLGEMASYLQGLDLCEKDPDTDECKELCARARRRISQGVLARAFEPLKERHPEVCDKDE